MDKIAETGAEMLTVYVDLKNFIFFVEKNPINKKAAYFFKNLFSHLYNYENARLAAAVTVKTRELADLNAIEIPEAKAEVLPNLGEVSPEEKSVALPDLGKARKNLCKNLQRARWNFPDESRTFACLQTTRRLVENPQNLRAASILDMQIERANQSSNPIWRKVGIALTILGLVLLVGAIASLIFSFSQCGQHLTAAQYAYAVIAAVACPHGVGGSLLCFGYGTKFFDQPKKLAEFTKGAKTMTKDAKIVAKRWTAVKLGYT